MKRLLQSLMAVLIAVSVFTAYPVSAEADPQMIAELEEEIRAIEERIDEGVIGFYRKNGTYDEIVQMIDMGNELSRRNLGKAVTVIGDSRDATSFDNVLKALDLIEEGNLLRESDEHRRANPDGMNDDLVVSDYLMALAQIQANYTSQVFAHWKDLKNAGYFYYTGENIATANYSSYDPFDGWYTTEKLAYDAYVEDHPGADADAIESECVSYYSEKYADEIQSGTMPTVRMVGHYLNLVNPLNDNSTRRADITGLGFSRYPESGYGYTYAQEFARSNYPTSNGTVYMNGYGQTYSVEDYRQLLQNYISCLDSQLADARERLEKLKEEPPVPEEPVWKIRYVLEDGAYFEQITALEYEYDYDSTVHQILAARPRRDCYAFLCWEAILENDPGTVLGVLGSGESLTVNEPYAIPENGTLLLIPVWKKLYTFDLIYEVNNPGAVIDANGSSEYVVTYEDADPDVLQFEQVTASKNGFVFKGWSLSNDAQSAVTENRLLEMIRENPGSIRLYGTWEEQQVTVIYHLNSDSAYAPGYGTGEEYPEGISQVYNASALQISLDVRNGDLILKGWALSREDADAGTVTYRNHTAVTADPLPDTIEVYAVWERNTDLYEIVYQIDEAEAGLAINGIIYTSERPFTDTFEYTQSDVSLVPETPIRHGYIFIGWAAEKEDGSLDLERLYMPGESIPGEILPEAGSGRKLILHAQWKAPYTVKMDLNGGRFADPETPLSYPLPEDEEYLPEDPVRTGYVFTGWYEGKNKTPTEAVINRNTTLKAKWKIDSTYTGLAKSGSTFTYYKNGKKNTKFKGASEYEGTLYYVTDGTVNRKFTGIASYNGEKYYFYKGVNKTDKTGLVTYSSTVYRIADGRVDVSATGIFKKGTSFVYLEQGIQKKTFTGLYPYEDPENGNPYLMRIKKGVFDGTFTGISSYDGVRHYVYKGYVKYDKNGLITYNDYVYVIRDGLVDTEATGVYKKGKSLVYISSGKQDKTFTGIRLYDNATPEDPEDDYLLYIKKGVFYKYSGTALYAGDGLYYRMKDGKVNTAKTGLVPKGKTLLVYVTAGRQDTGFTGIATYDKVKYWVISGTVDSAFSDTVEYDGTYYIIKNGKVNTAKTGLAEVGSGERVYFKNGIQNNAYKGLALFDGVYYYVENGNTNNVHNSGYRNEWEYIDGIWYHTTDNNYDKQSESSKYMVNVNTTKFHKMTCGEIKKMDPENKVIARYTVKQLKSWGYSPCKKCNP